MGRSRLRTVALALTVFLSMTALAAGLQDGVYTEEQANRGRSVYRESCGSCHGSDLAGGPGAPPLVGEPFTERWAGQTVADLYDSIRTGMPLDNPGSLTDEASIDITAYLLQRNNFPAGKAELATNLEALKKLTIPKK